MEFVFEDKSSQGFSQPKPAAVEPLQMNSSNNLFGNSFSNSASSSGASPISQPSRRSRRSLPDTVEDIGITGTRRKRATKKAASPKVKYVKAPSKRRAKGEARFNWTWQKFWWMVAIATFTRLLFMESGVFDYYHLENTIKENHNKLALIQKENREIVSEIHKIQTSPKYQRKMARDHLGVISSNEYLVIFSGDSH